MKTYFRPSGLVYGPDATALVNTGRAGVLAGHSSIAFTMAEVITREGTGVTRVMKPYGEIAHLAEIRMVEAPRPCIAGLDLTQVQVMGIVNVTPDSFSDGGRFIDSARAIEHGKAMVEDGATVLDVGGESTRPGSDPVSEDEELSRIIPVIAGLKDVSAVSADTRKGHVMQAAAKAGAKIINDVSALTYDATAPSILAERKLPVILMHAQGEPRTMQLNPVYGDVALDVYDALEARIESAMAAGIARGAIVVDPGIGFGKTYRHNLELVRQLTMFHGLGVPLLVGLSRKSYIGSLTGEKVAGQRLAGSVGGALHAIMNGVHILRVHDVKATVQAAKVFTCGLTPDLAEF